MKYEILVLAGVGCVISMLPSKAMALNVPICFLQRSNGQIVDLTSLCTSRPVVTTTTVAVQPQATQDDGLSNDNNQSSRYLFLGKNSLGFSVFLDKSSVSNKGFTLAELRPSGSRREATYSMSCSEGTIRPNSYQVLSSTGVEIDSGMLSGQVAYPTRNSIGGKALAQSCAQIGAAF